MFWVVKNGGNFPNKKAPPVIQTLFTLLSALINQTQRDKQYMPPRAVQIFHANFRFSQTNVKIWAVSILTSNVGGLFHLRLADSGLARPLPAHLLTVSKLPLSFSNILSQKQHLPYAKRTVNTRNIGAFMTAACLVDWLGGREFVQKYLF